MESKKAKQYCQERKLYRKIDYTFFGETLEIAGIAEAEMKEKTIEAHRKSCPYFDDETCSGQDDIVGSPHVGYWCHGKCEYMKLFKYLINK